MLLDYILIHFRGTVEALAYTNFDHTVCPHQIDKIGHTWKYLNESEVWNDAGAGLEVRCTGQYFLSVKRDK